MGYCGFFGEKKRVFSEKSGNYETKEKIRMILTGYPTISDTVS